MVLNKLLFYSLVFLIVSWPMSEVMSTRSYYKTHGEKEHTHSTEPPCAICPRHGICVPHVQCPAHIRSGSYNPQCHLDGNRQIGICCFTGRHHAAESDLKSHTTISVEDLKAAHVQSHKKLSLLLEQADALRNNQYYVINTSDPSFGHHLSLVTHDERIQTLGRGGLLNLFTAEELKTKGAVTNDELLLGLTDHTDGPFCPPLPKCEIQNRYRSIGGECNNADHLDWGSANTGYERLLPPAYGDGIWSPRTTASGLPLPSARAVSRTLLLEGHHPSPTHNLMFSQFGQFISHDISKAVIFTFGNDSVIPCCSENGVALPQDLQHWGCLPIIIDSEDEFYKQYGQKCINFVRTQLAPASDCSVGYAKQMNGATHYTDLSHIYGNTDEKTTRLRTSGGLLNVFKDYGRELLPLTEKEACLYMKDGAACFESGDNRGNQLISLTVLHTIWMREHNRIARALSKISPSWDEDTVFFEARRIVQAEYQHIVYNEWLPVLLGTKIMEAFDLLPSPGYSKDYDPNMNPSMTAEFAAAAMRFGHSTVDRQLTVLSPKHKGVYESIFLPEVMFQPSRLRLKPFLDRLLIGLAWQPMQNVDPFVTEALSRYMFHGQKPYGLDLAAINIQRGRDFGIRSYNDYRKLIGLEPFVDFNQYSPSAAKRLSSVYSHPDDIDMWVGGLLEESEAGIVGPSFANIIADQFTRLKKGDRYYYEHGPEANPGAFTPSQLLEIKKITLSRIICDNSDGIELLYQPPRAFVRSDFPGNQPVQCDSPIIPTIDLNKFKKA